MYLVANTKTNEFCCLKLMFAITVSLCMELSVCPWVGRSPLVCLSVRIFKSMDQRSMCVCVCVCLCVYIRLCVGVPVPVFVWEMDTLMSYWRMLLSSLCRSQTGCWSASRSWHHRGLTSWSGCVPGFTPAEPKVETHPTASGFKPTPSLCYPVSLPAVLRGSPASTPRVSVKANAIC